MARRDLQEINAGSMADIAFLLLIFFLVTTTMEVDAGIGRTLPLKRELPPDYKPPDIHARDILEINCNSNDQLLVEGRIIEVGELEDIVIDFYTINKNGERDPDMPLYRKITTAKCQAEISKIQPLVDENPDEQFYQDELESWETKLKLCQDLPTGQYDEIAKSAVIRLKNQAGTSYGLYIEIQNILKKVVNNLRVETCDEIWGKDYFALDESDEKDQEIIKKLRILVPERIIEAKIDR